MIALNNISIEQAHTTEHILKKCKRLLDYIAAYPSIFGHFYASDMILHIDSNAAYFVKPRARSRVAGVFYLGNMKPRRLPQLNGAILIEYKTLRHVVASAAEVETGGIFHMRKRDYQFSIF